MRPRPVPVMVVTVTLAAATTVAALAQEQLTGVVLPIEGRVLPLERTIVDLDGTRTTETDAATTIALDADVFFDFDDADLLPAAADVLDRLAARLAEEGVDEVTITGHTDSVGDDDYNQRLSEARAESVERYLTDLLPGLRTSTSGAGSSEPVAPNETDTGQDFPEGRALNRRVEVSYGTAG